MRDQWQILRQHVWSLSAWYKYKEILVFFHQTTDYSLPNVENKNPKSKSKKEWCPPDTKHSSRPRWSFCLSQEGDSEKHKKETNIISLPLVDTVETVAISWLQPAHTRTEAVRRREKRASTTTCTWSQLCLMSFCKSLALESLKLTLTKRKCATRTPVGYDHVVPLQVPKC